MFDYADPSGTGVLQRHAALAQYRAELHADYVHFARLPHAAFTLREAFDQVPDGGALVSTVMWLAFPLTANATENEIDRQRLTLQDEYVEWRVERNSGGAISRVTFTTEFPEFYQALASVSADALIDGIREVIPDANPTVSELFGPAFNPAAATAQARAQRLKEVARQNPWNNGQKNILFLSHGSNTRGALFGLLGECGVSRNNIPAHAVCGSVGGACVPGRSSDPRVCEAAQDLARGGRAFTPADPPGIRMLRLQGIWKLNGNQIDINNPRENQGLWTVSRNGRRAVLDVRPGLTFVDDPISSGAAVSAQLEVGADVLSAREDQLPPWARTGQESSRVIV